MDLSELSTTEAHEEGAEVNILNPNTGDKTDVYIKVLGPDSKEWRKQQKKQTAHYLKSLRSGEETDDTDLTIDSLVAVTIGWRGISKDGKPLEFSRAECKNLYTNSPRVMDQVDRFIGDYRNFTKG